MEKRMVVIRNPYEHRIPAEKWRELLGEVVSEATAWLKHLIGAGQTEEGRESFGFVLIDPTAPHYLPTEEAIMMMAIIGPDGIDYLANAIAKVSEHRDRGVEAGVQVFTLPWMLEDGDFRYGYSACVDNTYGGGSGQSQIQDRLIVQAAISYFNYLVALETAEWAERQPEGHHRWFCDQDEAGERYSAAVVKLWSDPVVVD